MPLDFDLDEALRLNDVREINEGTIDKLMPFIYDILKGLNAPFVTALDVIEAAIKSGGAVTPMEGIHQGLPTMDFLRSLGDEYFWKQVPIPSNYGFDVPFSLINLGDRIYLRIHMAEEEFLKLRKSPVNS